MKQRRLSFRNIRKNKWLDTTIVILYFGGTKNIFTDYVCVYELNICVHGTFLNVRKYIMPFPLALWGPSQRRVQPWGIWIKSEGAYAPSKYASDVSTPEEKNHGHASLDLFGTLYTSIFCSGVYSALFWCYFYWICLKFRANLASKF